MAKLCGSARHRPGTWLVVLLLQVLGPNGSQSLNPYSDMERDPPTYARPDRRDDSAPLPIVFVHPNPSVYAGKTDFIEYQRRYLHNPGSPENENQAARMPAVYVTTVYDPARTISFYEPGQAWSMLSRRSHSHCHILCKAVVTGSNIMTTGQVGGCNGHDHRTKVSETAEVVPVLHDDSR